MKAMVKSVEQFNFGTLFFDYNLEITNIYRVIARYIII